MTEPNNTILQEILTTLQNMLELQIHMHDKHLHPVSHYGDAFIDKQMSNNKKVNIVPNKAATLISEFHGNEDLDNNGLTYGKDFKILDNYEKPHILKSIENSPYWIEPNRVIKWSNYLEDNYATSYENY